MRYLSVFTVLALSAAASANIVVTVTENTVTNTVTFVSTGSLDVTLFTNVQHPTNSAAGNYLASGFGGNMMGLGNSPGPLDFFQFSTPFTQPFGTGSYGSSGVFSGPDVFGFSANGSANDQLYLPLNYVSNTPISSTVTFDGSFASRSITPSTVVMTLPGNQTITMNFASVPTPAAAALLGLGGLAASRRRR